MGKYIKKFESEAAYEAFTETSAFVKPNVSLCVKENVVKYNPLEVVFVTAITISGETSFSKGGVTERTFTAITSPDSATTTAVSWSLDGQGSIVSQDGVTCTVSLSGDANFTTTLVATATDGSAISTSVTLTYEAVVALQSITISGPDSWDYYDGHQPEETWTFAYEPSNTPQTGVTAAFVYVSGSNLGDSTGTIIDDNICKISYNTQTHGFNSYYDLVITSTVNPNISATKRIHFYSSR